MNDSQSLKKIYVCIAYIAMASILYGCRKDIKSECQSWIEGDVSYRQKPTVEDVWRMSESVFERTTFRSFMTDPWLHFCSVMSEQEVNCARQVAMQHGYGKHFVSTDDTFLILYGFRDNTYQHIVYGVMIDGETWLFDRNYGGAYPAMPMREKEYLAIYGDRIYTISKRNR